MTDSADTPGLWPILRAILVGVLVLTAICVVAGAFLLAVIAAS